MLQQLKDLSKETLIYGTSTVIGRFLNFLLVPFYVNVLHSTAEYGISTSLYTYISFLGIIYTLGLEAAFFRYAAKGENEQRSTEEEKRLFSSPFLFVVVFGGILTAGILFAAPALVWPAFHDPKSDITKMVPMLTRILRYGALIIFFDSLNVLPFAALRLDRRAKWFATIRFINIALTLVLNFVLILGLHWGVEGIFIANLIASAAMLAMLLPTIIKRFEPRVTRLVMKKMLPFGLTNVPAYLSAMMVQVIDRPIVQNLLGLGILGIYQANYRLGFTMMVFVSLFEYAWRPFFLRQARTDDARARLIFSRVFTYFMLIAVVGFLVLSLFLPYIVSVQLPLVHHSLLPPKYLVGLDIIPVVLAAYIFQGMYTNFIAGIYIQERNKVLPFITGLGAATNVITNILLIPILGIMGAALATLFAYVAMAGALYWQAQKVYYIPYDWKRIGMLSAIVAIAYGAERGLRAGTFSLFQHHGANLVMDIGILVIVAIALVLSGFFSKGEIEAFKRMLGRPTAATTPPAAMKTEIGSKPEPVEEAGDRREDI